MAPSDSGGAPDDRLTVAHASILSKASGWSTLTALFDGATIGYTELGLVGDLVRWKLLEYSGKAYRRVVGDDLPDGPV